MGFLDNSTCNILVDAVLTEAGRRAFASNGANLDEAGLVIAKFALGDDEVDYTNVRLYGTELGRERIEKLTPVLESSTNTVLAMRSMLTTFSDDDLEYLPRLTLETPDTSTITLARQGGAQNTQRELTFRLQAGGEGELTNDQRDTSFFVRVPSRFLRISGRTPIGRDPDRSEVYQINADRETGTGGVRARFVLKVKSFDSELFETFGATSGNADAIRTRISVTGITTGATQEVEVVILRGE